MNTNINFLSKLESEISEINQQIHDLTIRRNALDDVRILYQSKEINDLSLNSFSADSNEVKDYHLSTFHSKDNGHEKIADLINNRRSGITNSIPEQVSELEKKLCNYEDDDVNYKRLIEHMNARRLKLSQ